MDLRSKLSVWMYILSIVLVIVGGLNWGSVGLFGTNFVDGLTNFIPKGQHISRVIYILVGLAAVYLLFRRDTYLPFLGQTAIPTGGLDYYHNYDANKVTIDATGAIKVVYWAADPGTSIADSPEIAYNRYENSGVVPVNPDGRADLYFKCPKSYKVGMLFKSVLPKHIHYRLVYDNIRISEVRTVEVICD